MVDLPKNILICPDSFKDSLTSIEICEILTEAFIEQNISITTTSIPLADGGEGTIDVMQDRGKFQRISTSTIDPLGRSIAADYLWEDDTRTMIIEMAQSSGVELLTPDEQNCLYTSTYGTGLQILDAIEKYQPAKIYLTVGSSATNDSGLGMLAAMGCVILNRQGECIDMPKGKDLINIVSIKPNDSFERVIESIEFVVVNDVDNPFSGLFGAAYTYGKQKGASPNEIKLLDEGLDVVRKIIIKDLSIDLNTVRGSGAGGGVAGGAYAYLNASMISGASFVCEYCKLDVAIGNADLVITGEGRLDSQSLHGKLVHHIANQCKEFNKELVIICGANDMKEQQMLELGAKKIYALNDYNKGDYNDETTRRDLKKVAVDIGKDLGL